MERLDLLHQRVGETLPGDERHRGNVIDRLFRIKLGALAADLVENIDEMAFHIEQTQLEHGEQAARAGANNQHVSLDRFAHYSSCVLSISVAARVGAAYRRETDSTM